MRISQKISYALFFAFVILFVSMFVKIIPCQTAPDVPNPQYTWTLCNLDPDSNTAIGAQRIYLGYTSGLKEMYVLFLVLIFVLAMIVLHFTAKRKD